MEHYNLEPGLVGRDEEMNVLESLLDDCRDGHGNTVFISGEVGVGKTKLAKELIRKASSLGMEIIESRCMSESLEPLSAVKDAFRSSDLYHLIAEVPPPKVLSTYLMDSGGLLMAKAERSQTDLDPDIFASMLKGVANFVSDSLSMMGEGEKGGVSGIGYKGYNILMETEGEVSLVLVIEGEENEFLIDDMQEVLHDIYGNVENLSQRYYEDSELTKKISWFIDSGKYEGRYLVDDSKLKRENLFDNVLLGLRREAADTPVILFIDDLQWADPSTLSLIHYLARNIRNDPILLMGAYRPEELLQRWDGSVHQLKTTLRNMNREDILVEVELNRLDKVTSIAMLQDTLGEVELPVEFYDMVYNENEGNPYYLLEFIRHMIEDEQMVKKGDVWTLKTSLDQIEIPSRIYDLVDMRLDRLGEHQKKILDFASVMGIEFDSSMIEKALGYDRRELLTELSGLEDAHGLIASSEEGYRFDHNKVRESLYNGLNRELREEYHRMIGEYYEEQYESGENQVMGLMIHHFYKAKDERVIGYLIEAGHSAQERYANEEAERFFSNALELLPGSREEEILHVHKKLGEICTLKGDYEAALEHYQKVLEEENDDINKAELYGNISELYANIGDYEKAVESVDYGMKLNSNKICSLLKTKGWVLLRNGDHKDARQVFLEELRTAESIGDNSKIAQALHDLGAADFRMGCMEDALENMNKAVEKWEKTEDLKGLSTSLNNIGIIYYYQSDFDRALEYHMKSLDIKERIEDKRGVAISLNNIGAIYKNKGDFPSALECYNGSLEILEKVGDKLGVATTLNNLGTIYYYQEAYDKALECHKRSLRISEDVGDEQFTLHIRCSLNEIFLAGGDIELALEHGKQIINSSQELGASGEEGIARRVQGMVLREIGELDGAEKEFRKARELLDDADNSMEFTRVLYEFALLFRKRGQSERAEGHMKAALNNFKELGMVWWAERAEDVLEEQI